MEKQNKNTPITNLFDDPVRCCKVYDKGKLVLQQNISYLFSDIVCETKYRDINPKDEPGDSWNVFSGKCGSGKLDPIIATANNPEEGRHT
ncbi:hypothetical protein [Bacillus pseudomycoides]|uniref:hypothetical protein n=1 Tax=Bacillus pseudomycoides TaxID=64104 RepID=UPI003D6539A2